MTAVPLRILSRHAPTLCAIAALALALPAHAADSCAANADDPASQTAQRMLQALADTNGVPGMGTAVWRDGEVVWTGCVGVRNVDARQPVRRDTVFRLASVSKVIAATAAAKLAEEGRLDLDAAVGGMLPWLPAEWAAVTVRQLAAHISGAPHYTAADELRGRTHYPTSRDAVGIFSGRALLTPPGTAYSYSSWGYTLMGAVIEAQSGEHFVDYVTRHVVAGLEIGADGTFAADRASRLYDIEHHRVRELARLDFSYTWPGGGLAATPQALVEFGGRMLQNGIVAAETWAAMRRPVLLTDGTPARERDYEVGFGWRLGRDTDGARTAYHAGITDGARSMLMLWPEHDVAASLLSNAMWVSSMESTTAMLAAAFRPRPAGLHVAACPTRHRYGGTFKGARIEGEVAFRLEAGRCVGVLGTSKPLRDYFASAYAWPEHKLRIVALDADGGLSRAALVTPYGLYDLRATAAGTWTARLGMASVLELSL